MRTVLLFASLLALAGLAVEQPKETSATQRPARQAKAASVLPEAVAGVDDAELAKIRRALLGTGLDEPVVAARKRLAELKERTRFTNGRNEAEDLRADFEQATAAMFKATIEAVQKFDPTVSKEALVLTLNEMEAAGKKRAQENLQKLREKEAAEAKAAKKDAPEAKPEAPAAPTPEAKPMTPAQLLADVEGVSAEDMKKFRIAALVAQKDPAVKELKAKQAELRKQAEFASADEKRGMRGEFEALQADIRKANLAAVSKAAPSLSKETLETIMTAIEDRAKAAAKKAPSKATKTPLKPFPFGEKK